MKSSWTVDVKTCPRVRSVALIAKEANTDALYLGRSIEDWLRNKGIEAFLVIHSGAEDALAQLPPVDFALILGGDGTFVSAARSLMGKNIPIAGINFGRVGFLTTISPDAWEPALVAILQGKALIQSRMALSFSHIRENRTLASGRVINDVVLTRGMFARLVNLELRINRTVLTTLRSDGIIFATPTGSSGYARSSGGPLLAPALNAYVSAAICPYSGAFPPMVLEAEIEFSVTAKTGGTSLYLNLDGQEARPIKQDDMVVVHGIPDAFQVLDPRPEKYFEKLRSVGFIRGGGDSFPPTA